VLVFADVFGKFDIEIDHPIDQFLSEIMGVKEFLKLKQLMCIFFLQIELHKICLKCYNITTFVRIDSQLK